jgi:hypothetical protein
VPNAYVTVDPAGRLTLGAMVAVVDDEYEATIASNEVPYLASVGVLLFWHHVEQALIEVGWSCVYGSFEAEARDGRHWFDAEPWNGKGQRC